MEPDLNHRVGLLERDFRDHAKTISNIVEEVRVISSWQRSQDLIMAREDERDKALNKRLDAIEADIRSIKGGFSKAQWVVISAVILAIVAFAFKGGFAL